MAEDQESKLIHDTAEDLVGAMLREADTKDICAHCLGIDMIYMIAREMTANTDVDAGEILNAVHLGVVDGTDDMEPAAGGESGGPKWTVH